MNELSNITADAVALQERDDFRADGWLKLIAPAKVNLHLAIGERREDGYHDAATIMHALMLHDVVYLRRADRLMVRMVAGDPTIDVPDVATDDNLAARAILRLAEALDLPANATNVEVRIEKNIPAQAGLGGGSADAAAALVGAAQLWGIAADNPKLAAVARTLGADVAFFLHGGCAYLEGTGADFAHALEPSKQSVVLVKPAGGVSTAAAYRQFDADPACATDAQAEQARTARNAADVQFFNNLAPAAETLLPELADIRSWLTEQPGAQSALLCGSGACTFATCEDFSAAAAISAAARKRGWWSRTTSLSSARVLAVSTDGSTGVGA